MYAETSGRKDLDKFVTAESLPLIRLIDELAGAASASAVQPLAATTGTVRIKLKRLRKASYVNATPTTSAKRSKNDAGSIATASTTAMTIATEPDIAGLTTLWRKVAEAMEGLGKSSLSVDGHASVLQTAVENHLKSIVHTQTRTLNICIHRHTPKKAHRHTHSHAYTHIDTHTYTHTYTHTRTHTFTLTHTYTHIDTHTHTNTHTHTFQLAITTDGRLRVLLA
jgi:UDP-N-acetylglucosamine enolpyruvyl transferase